MDHHVPASLRNLQFNQSLIPRLAKDEGALKAIRESIERVPTRHELHRTSATRFRLPESSVHLVATSPPYWVLKRYNDSADQLGHVTDYEAFLDQLDEVWRHCFDALVPGGRLVIVVGDVCRPRKLNHGHHLVVPLHASIVERCRRIGFHNLTPIIWQKIANGAHESGGCGMYGSPYEPNAIIKNDVEFILIQRKPGHRNPSQAQRILSTISASDHRRWFQSIWTGIPGASTKQHPAPFPLELAERMVRMCSYVGDTVYDPFAGTGTTALAAAKWGRHSVSVEVDPDYFRSMEDRLRRESAVMPSMPTLRVHESKRPPGADD